MELLPFIREASEYSAAITIALYGLLSLQFRFQGSALRREFDTKLSEMERAENVRHNKLEKQQTDILEAIHNDLHALELAHTKDNGALDSRLTAVETQLALMRRNGSGQR